jgi:hypothetical protein
MKKCVCFFYFAGWQLCMCFLNFVGVALPRNWSKG